MQLLQRRCWIFDLDGTLTIAIHDFDAPRAGHDEVAQDEVRLVVENFAVRVDAVLGLSAVGEHVQAADELANFLAQTWGIVDDE